MPGVPRAVDVIDLAEQLRREARAELLASYAAGHDAGCRSHVDWDAGGGGIGDDDGRPWVLLREERGRVHVGWRVASGPAASAGAPGRGSSGRRSYQGWLGQFALDRVGAARTAMDVRRLGH